MARDLISIARNIAEDRGGKCLSDECTTTKQKITLECANGHIWEASFGNLKYHNQWCKKCVGLSQKNSIAQAIILAENKNGKCLSIEYINNHEKLTWECESGHIFNSSFNKVSIGRWCPYCSRRVKYTLNFAQKQAENKNGKCLSTEYINNHEKLTWECESGHIWESCLSNILSGKWCGRCHTQSTKKYTLQSVIDIARLNNGECLSDMYENYNSDLIWQCKNEHVWSAPLARIKGAGRWCPYCKLTSQNKLKEIIDEIFSSSKVYTNYRGFNWLINKQTNCKQEIDIFVAGPDDFSLAIEYDGHGHFFPVNFGGCSDKQAKKIFDRTKELDLIKNKKISENKDDVRYFVRFNYKDELEINKIKNKLIKNNIPF